MVTILTFIYFTFISYHFILLFVFSIIIICFVLILCDYYLQHIASGGAFILKSMINPKLREQFVDKISDLEIKQRGLLLTILGMIATNNNEIDQGIL